MVGGLVTAAHAQLMAERGLPRQRRQRADQAGRRQAGLGHAGGAAGLAPMYRRLSRSMAAVTYVNAFYLVGWLRSPSVAA